MSHLMTALAMRQAGLKPAAKIVLYWLADHHNSETSRCFPSLNTLAAECQMTRPTVIRNLEVLEAAGLIRRHKRLRENGSQTSTSYELILDGACKEIKQGLLKNDTGGLLKNDTPLTLEDNNLVIEHTHIVPKQKKPHEILEQWASKEAVASFIAYRKLKGAFTVTAAKRLSKHLEVIFNEGGDTDDALGMAEENGWKSVEPEWYFKRASGRGKGDSIRPDQDPTLRAIFNAATARPS